MREDLQHDFDLAEFNASARVMKCGRQLFPHSEKSAEAWSIRAYERWTRNAERCSLSKLEKKSRNL